MKKNSYNIVIVYMLALIVSLNSFAQHSKNDHNLKSIMDKVLSADKRRPVIMTKEMGMHQLKNMRNHLEAISEIVTAMSTKDFKKMVKASLRLASSQQMKMMCNNMGKATPGFTKMGLALHSTADTLVKAAKSKNYDLFVKNLSATLQTCTSCHSTFKQKIVSSEKFRKSMIK